MEQGRIYKTVRRREGVDIMEYYIVSEEELNDKLEHLKGAGFIIGDIKGQVDFILESKQPVELVGSGEVIKITKNVIEFGEIFYSDETETLIFKMLEPHIEDKIKFYIEKEKK